MDGDLSESGGSIPQFTSEMDLKQSNSGLKNEILPRKSLGSLEKSFTETAHFPSKNSSSVRTKLDSINVTTRDFESSFHKVLSKNEENKSIERITVHSISEQRSVGSKRETQARTSLASVTSELISVEEPISTQSSKTHNLNSGRSRSQITASVQNPNITDNEFNNSEIYCNKHEQMKTLSLNSGRSRSQITASVQNPNITDNEFNNSEKYCNKHEQMKTLSSYKSLDEVINNQYGKPNLESGENSSFIKFDSKDIEHTQELSSNLTTHPAESLSRSESSTTVEDTKWFDNPQCIPPWAKTVRRLHGMTCSDHDMSHTNLQEKIKSLMKKHSNLMLLKRGESTKQLIIKPNECGGMGTVKIASKNTRYYMTHIPKEFGEQSLGSDLTSSSTEKNISDKKSVDMTNTNKTSRYQAKAEASKVLKSLYNSNKYKGEMDKEESKLKLQQNKCFKITPSKIRNFVNSQSLDKDERKLDEIIQIRKVHSRDQIDGKSSSKYIINVPVPQCNQVGGTTVNKITLKEKHKLKINTVEELNENITEITYNRRSETKGSKGRIENHYTADENVLYDVIPHSEKPKSHSKSKSLKVTATSTPVKLKKEKRDKDKILLIQYELEESKKGSKKYETEKPAIVSQKLLGVRQPHNENLKDIYLYGADTDGNLCKERITKVDNASPTLRERVNAVFEELKSMSLKPCAEFEPTKDLQPSVSSKMIQHPSTTGDADTVSVQAFPEVRSIEVQVQDSILFHQQRSMDHQSTLSLSLADEKERDYIEPSIEIKHSEKHPPDSSQPDDSITTPKSSIIEGEQTDVRVESETELSKLDEKDASSEEKIHSMQDIEIQETTNRKETEDEDQNDDQEHVSRPMDAEHVLESQEEENTDEQTSDRILSGERSINEEKSGLENDEETLREEERGSLLTAGSLKDKEQNQIYNTKVSGNFEGDEEDKEDKKEEEDKEEEEDKKEEEDKEDKKEEEDKEDKKEEEDKEDKKEEEDDEEKISGEGQIGKEFKEDEYYGMSDEAEAEEHVSDNTVKGQEAWNGKEHAEDIRSYDFDPAKDFELRMIPSSKFFHQKDSLRKMNWTEDVLYLEKTMCPQLVRGLAEIAVKQPPDPISYLAHWIYKGYHNSQQDEQTSVLKEHLQVAKDMVYSKRNKKLICKKFNVQRYPEKLNEDHLLTEQAYV
ncbi:glutamic acid-rich protein-like [Macrosteles quadrilineatus]|uniref:glutamic acid-rich protein-like n=1 Tax=Macrosteles quadrilineatus TaxID=74068 RepID=UPI0023E1A413|nr:glutamic acid-rich protein-like [Macrosteles quadrilineatus]